MKKQAGISKGARAAMAAEAEALAQAVAAAESGNMSEAERIARVVLAQKPQHLEAEGIAAQQRGRVFTYAGSRVS